MEEKILVLDYDDFNVYKLGDEYYAKDDDGEFKVLLVKRVPLKLDDSDPSDEELFGLLDGGVDYDYSGETAGYNGESTEYLYFTKIRPFAKLDLEVLERLWPKRDK